MLKKNIFCITALLCMALANAAVGHAAAINLPKTGQTTVYATGDNGDLQKGVAWTSPRFSAVADTSVTDTLTGLIWAPNGNLMPSRDSGWDADGTANDGRVTWQHALDYVAKLNNENYLGYDDWRLPNRKELRSLANYGETSVATWLNTQDFSNVQASYYWSSSTYAGITTYALYVLMLDGYVYANNKTNNNYVWPVRGGQSGSFAYLTISKSGTGTGSVTVDKGAVLWSGSTGIASYGSAMTVNITATPDSGINFTGWSGACSGAGACEVTMDESKNVTATFSSGPELTPPDAPVVDGITPTNNTRPRWTWTSGGGDGNGTYRRRLDGGSWVTTTALSWRPGSALSDGMRTLEVQERDDEGNWSESGSFTIEVDTALTAPAAPASLSATLDSGVSLSWTDSADNELGYRVYRRKSTESAWTKISDSDPGATSSTDLTYESNTTYVYYIRAWNGAGSAKSKDIAVTTVAIAPPKGLSATAGSGTNVAWQDASLAEDGYEVWRKGEGAAWARVAILGANSVSWLDESATAGALYTYQVCATTEAGGSACSTKAGDDGPTDLSATYDPVTGVTLEWTDNSSDELGFKVWRRARSETAMTELGTVGADGTGWVDDSVSAGTTYYYKVCAYNAKAQVCSEVVPAVVP